jgi:radical SAM superfamily enzyme YgiQ (UPF0313 family)
MSRVLLVVKSKTIETLGTMYISAVVKQTGNDCKIVTIDEAPVMTKIWKPEIIGYSIMTGDQEKFRILNWALKGIGIMGSFSFYSIAGNCHPTFFPEDCDWTDVIIKGEAEQQFADLLQSGLKYPDLDSIPYPDRTDFPDMKIRDFITSRGCPNNCTYCFNELWAEACGQKTVRVRSVRNVIKEVEQVNPKFAYFQDSCFGVSTKWLKEFSEKYPKIPFHCHLRPVQVTNERAAYLHDSGCVSVRIALETASDRLRILIGRPKTSNEEAYNASKILRKWGIKLMIQNMLGLMTSTIEDDLNTLEANIRCRPDYGWCSIFSPYPGTKLGDLCKAEGYYTGDYSEISDSFFDTSVLNFDEKHKEQLVCLQRIFALCVEARYLPKVEELTLENFPKLVHKICRKVGDDRLYGGVI